MVAFPKPQNQTDADAPDHCQTCAAKAVCAKIKADAAQEPTPAEIESELPPIIQLNSFAHEALSVLYAIGFSVTLLQQPTTTPAFVGQMLGEGSFMFAAIVSLRLSSKAKKRERIAATLAAKHRKGKVAQMRIMSEHAKVAAMEGGEQ